MTAVDKTPRFQSASEALQVLRSGERVFVGSGAAEPKHLVQALCESVENVADVEVIHILTLGDAPYAQQVYEGKLRHNALFIGSNIRSAVQQGLADYTPCFLHEVPSLFRDGKLPIDVALIQVSPPRDGKCSLGVSVDVIKSAAESAKYVIAQINTSMPWVHGEAHVNVSDIDVFVEHSEPLCELPSAPVGAVEAWIGRYIARLIEDGSTLQLGVGKIPNAVLSALHSKRNLGIHSEMVSDGVLSLIEKGVLNGQSKTLHPNKHVVSFCLGTKALYNAVHENEDFAFYPSDYVNSPFVVAKNHKMVSINSALQIDLTGQVAADSLGSHFYSGVGGQVDFIRGAAGSHGGKSILGFPSTAKEESISRIVPVLSEGTGVVTTRADIDFVVTEYGIASLKGRTIRERAMSLIQVAHPKFREELIKKAKKLGYLDADQPIPLAATRYEIHFERTVVFGDIEVFFRPLKPTDAKRLTSFLYSHSLDTTYMRFGVRRENFSEAVFEDLLAIDYHNSLAIGGFVKEGNSQRLIAVGRFYLTEHEKQADLAVTVDGAQQGKGIGTYLVNYLTWIAKEEGISKLSAQVLLENREMLTLFQSCFDHVRVESRNEYVQASFLVDHWKSLGEEDLFLSEG